MKKKDIRSAVNDRLVPMLNAAFEQGKAAQRLEDAQADFNFATTDAQSKINGFIEIFNTPDPSEIN